MAKRRQRIQVSRAASLLAGVLLIATSIGPVQAAVVRTIVNADFTSKPVSFGFGTLDFTLSNTGDNVFGSPVAITTSGGGAVRTIFGAPSVDFDPPRNALSYDSSLTYGSFASPTPIQYSGPPSLLGLADTIGGLTYYGYAQFYQDHLTSYAFQSTAGVGIMPPVPLPASAPLFGAALLAFGAVGYGLRRSKAAAAA